MPKCLSLSSITFFLLLIAQVSTQVVLDRQQLILWEPQFATTTKIELYIKRISLIDPSTFKGLTQLTEPTLTLQPSMI